MYHVVNTCIIILLLYLVSYLFSKIDYYSVYLHKKIWNWLLALTFMGTALAGLFMALQISYKWNITFTKTVLSWHVQLGIGMACIGIIHFLLHLSYFFGKKGKHRIESSQQNVSSDSKSDIGTNLFIVGFISSSFQLLLLREMMNITGGYELIAGVFLGFWLIISSFGASISRKSPVTNDALINLIFSLSPIVSLVLLLLIYRLFTVSGQTLSFLPYLLISAIVLLPFCLVSGFTFVKLISSASKSKGYNPGRSFAIETAGGILAGLLVSLSASEFLGTYQFILLIILCNTTYVILTFYSGNHRTKILIKIFCSALAILVVLAKPDIYFRQQLISGTKVTNSVDTPYGNITEGVYRGENNIFYNSRLLSYNEDVIEREENTHYAMLQSDSPDKVLIVSGPLESSLNEIYKYPVKKVIYVERDPALIKRQSIDNKHLMRDVVIANSDAFRFIRHSVEMVDVILLSVPPPSTLLLNRYYTVEFFSSVRNILNKGGIFICSPGPGNNYYNREYLALCSSVYNGLKEVFQNVMPVEGNKLYFIASDKELSTSFCRLGEMKGIQNSYVCSDYLNDCLTDRKSKEIKDLIDSRIKPNKLAFPVANMYFHSYNFSKKDNEKAISIIILIIIFALPVLIIKRPNLIMYVSAFALAGLEIIILLTLQIVIGYMYHLSGLMIATVMAGLAIGAGTENRLLKSFTLVVKGMLLMSCYIISGLLYTKMLQIESLSAALLFLSITAFIPSLITGHIFRCFAADGKSEERVSLLYSADLAGSALGFILISGIFVPVLGIRNSIFLLSLLILAGFLFGTIKNK